jgi:hypothetical protein
MELKIGDIETMNFRFLQRRRGEKISSSFWHDKLHEPINHGGDSREPSE